MTLRPSFPPPTNVAQSTTESRGALRGIVARNAGGIPRSGVFPPAVTLVTARASMHVNVAAFNAVAVRLGLPSFLYNDGTEVVSIGQAPAANSQYKVVYARQNEQSSPFADGSDQAVFGFVESDPSADPSLEAAIALLPQGALALASLLIPAGATTTTSAGVVLRQMFARATMAGGVTAVLDGNSYPDRPVQGEQIFRLDELTLEQYFNAFNSSSNPLGPVAAGWYPVSGMLPKFANQISENNGIGSNTVTPIGGSWGTSIDYIRGFSWANGELTILRTGWYEINCVLTLASGAWQSIIQINGANRQFGNDSGAQWEGRLVAGTRVRFAAFSFATNGSSLVPERGRASVRYIGPA